MKKKICGLFILANVFILSNFGLAQQKVDYSVVSVPEEYGIDFTMITSASDYVCMPIVQRTRNNITWLTNKIIDISPDGQNIAYLSYRNNTSNIFVKDVLKKGTSIQRTNRKAVLDFSYSPDGEFIIFSETVGKNNILFQTSSSGGFICRQITTGNKDYTPTYSTDQKLIFFSRHETGSTGIWSYNIKDNYVSTYTSGMNPCPIPNSEILLCVRINGHGKGEIWKINLSTGVEECILSDMEKSFSTPVLSPNGEWVLVVGSSPIHTKNSVYWNTDIYACRIDGTKLSQLTYHAADDLSPEWSGDGQYIYFISQRGSQDGTANIWRMTFNVL